ncbi:PREDICTED: low choriolytic enzyme-like [Wasmannia auropunctata]|uniref:low choriolytic enzyme-like n=1 Tax=Wasmannia auropunctata TaxID=64793 RepID=UPI0005EF322D|nr:PREDICTED: low choriolytic enzyme-like [Wasmannia auropunctata]
MLIVFYRLFTFAWTLLVFAIFESAVAISYVRNTEEWYKTVPDHETGIKVALWTKEMNINPEELGSYFEGDIMITGNTKRNGDTNENLRWSNGIIPYIIADHFDDNQLELINGVMDDYFNRTCITFVLRTDEEDYINIVSDNTGCSSNIGKIGGEQKVHLQIPGCVTLRGTVIHELLHVVGFWHEHTREDRDNYVHINWDNIEEETKKNFVKNDPGVTYTYGVPYDYGSVMHYSAYSFAKNNTIKTIIPTKDPNALIGQRQGFSDSDILKVNKMYNCI